MSRKILVFFPHNPLPARTGAHRRCLEILAGLRESGSEVIFLSSTSTSESQWTDASIQELERQWVKKVFIHKPNLLDRRSRGLAYRYYRFRHQEHPLSSMLSSPLGMRWWFSEIVDRVSPDSILMNYAYWDKLIDHQKLTSVHRVIETHDLVTLNCRMQAALTKFFQNSVIRLNEVSEHVISEHFFDQLQLSAQPQEFQIYDQYNCTIAISSSEANCIQQQTTQTQTVLVPMTQKPQMTNNDYSQAAILPVGPNPFNIQGYIYFAKKVLPHVLKQVPTFELWVSGSFGNHVLIEAPEGVTFLGFVPDLQAVYQRSRFLICPVFGGTGQQIKIIEAMAHGLPVVALKSAASRSPMQHGVNGLVAETAEEFASHVIQLWNDPSLCRQMGAAAREKIASEFSREHLCRSLSEIFG
jgi:glycosyltransferase involved in cell wall biosynthesis